jgi:hypothetical protein
MSSLVVFGCLSFICSLGFHVFGTTSAQPYVVIFAPFYFQFSTSLVDDSSLLTYQLLFHLSDWMVPLAAEWDVFSLKADLRGMARQFDTFTAEEQRSKHRQFQDIVFGSWLLVLGSWFLVLWWFSLCLICLSSLPSSSYMIPLNVISLRVQIKDIDKLPFFPAFLFDLFILLCHLNILT